MKTYDTLAAVDLGSNSFRLEVARARVADPSTSSNGANPWQASSSRSSASA